MEIFLDTANLEQIKLANSWGIIDGVTTNPSLIAKEGRKFEEVVKEIAAIVEGPISAEVISLEAEKMAREAEPLTQIHPNIVIKVPMTAEGLKATRTLKEKGIKTNVTLIFSANQALLAAKAGATYVSPFIGRLEDNGQDGIWLIKDIMTIFRNYGFGTRVIVASIRNPVQVIEAAKAGAHIATVPFNVLESMIKHVLTEQGIRKFLEDWKNVPKSN